jgi:hypothetical protein
MFASLLEYHKSLGGLLRNHALSLTEVAAVPAPELPAFVAKATSAE